MAAPPEAVWAALVDVDARTRWLPPTGMSGRFEWFDATSGGGYRLTLTYDDPSEAGKTTADVDVVEVRFALVEAPHRVVEEAYFDSDDPRFAGTMTIEWAVVPDPAGSLVRVTATGVPDGIDPADHATAFASSLAQLAAHVGG